MSLTGDGCAQTETHQTVPEKAAIISTIESVLDAAMRDDVKSFKAEVTPDFYVYDGGTRFDADEIMALIAQAHAAGTKLEWHITKPDVHIYGDTAWIAYVNAGTVVINGAATNHQWLESAFLVRADGTWKLSFWHSTPKSESR